MTPGRNFVPRLHSIKRHVLQSDEVSFESDRTAKNEHADKFWALALACQKERPEQPRRVPEVVARMPG